MKKVIKIKKRTKNLANISLMAAITCVLSVIAIPIPFSAVPFTLSLLGVFLSGCFLSPANALISQLIYILIGAIGLPVFSGFQGGLAVLFGPTGGFLISYPIIAVFTALFIKKSKTKMFIGMMLSLVFCYTIGTLLYCLSTKASVFAAITTMVIPFVLFDIIKALFAIFISEAIKKRIK